MTYELAKELKEAGFPTMAQRAAPDGLQEEGCVLIDGANYKVPTLEELVEACGPDFWNLNKRSNEKWGANALSCRADGDTAIEAVANLWLALNKVAKK